MEPLVYLDPDLNLDQCAGMMTTRGIIICSVMETSASLCLLL